MNRLSKNVVIISMDGLSGKDLDHLDLLPGFQIFLKDATYCKRVKSVYPSLTYPAHASIVTGRTPDHHRIIHNTFRHLGNPNPNWFWFHKEIRGKTLYDICLDREEEVASFLWPVTGRSKITYNLPEIVANRWWKHQITESLCAGSKLFQMNMFAKYRSLLDGLKQPELDDFSFACLFDTLLAKKEQVSLYMIHLIDLDTQRHRYGYHSDQAQEALRRLDRRLIDINVLLEQLNMAQDTTVVVLGDHSSQDVDTVIRINALFVEHDLIQLNKKGKVVSYQAMAQSNDGSCYIYIRDMLYVKTKVESLLEHIQSLNVLESAYTAAEARRMGADHKCAYLLEARSGYMFVDDLKGMIVEKIDYEKTPSMYRNVHGYHPDRDSYSTVFMMKGPSIHMGKEVQSMNLIDIGPTVARVMGGFLPEADGRVQYEFLDLDTD